MSLRLGSSTVPGMERTAAVSVEKKTFITYVWGLVTAIRGSFSELSQFETLTCYAEIETQDFPTDLRRALWVLINGNEWRLVRADPAPEVCWPNIPEKFRRAEPGLVKEA